MYYPYFRGKQYELITIRECAGILKDANFVPIIEPVKEALSGLAKALESVVIAQGTAILIVNPHHGNHSEDGEAILSLFEGDYKPNTNITPGILLSEYTSIAHIEEILSRLNGHSVTLIHSGFNEPNKLQVLINKNESVIRHIFKEANCGKLYQKRFKNGERVLIRDGFIKRANREYPLVEFFSDLHATFDEEKMDGFGDYLMVGDDYSETGGPAYAVAIHLTFINSDEEMHINHFVSISNDTPKDPAKKFSEALNKLISEISKIPPPFQETSSVKEFRELHTKRHFPGLGYVKKLSMKHHIETLAQYFSKK